MEAQEAEEQLVMGAFQGVSEHLAWELTKVCSEHPRRWELSKVCSEHLAVIPNPKEMGAFRGVL